MTKQYGIALLVMLVILVMGAMVILVNSLNSSALKITRDQISADTLAQAKDALIGDTISPTSLTSAGYLRLPDLGFKIGPAPSEGSSAPNFSGNSMDFSVIGKVPWKTLGISPPRDGQGECAWYAVSGRFKNTPKSNTPLNWDTSGQIDIIDGNGSAIANNAVALLIAPGPAIDGQNRILSDPAYTQCAGNYDARNYLDSYNSADAVSGEVNYFTGSTNSRVASNTNNKRFVMANSPHYNDRFLAVTVDDIFRPIIRRSDFSAQITALMDDPYFQNVNPSTTSKGTGNVACSSLGTPDNRTFCDNWKEMLLLTQLPAPTPALITINGIPTACTRVLIFGGQKVADQTRATVADKSSSANYLEGTNLAAFATPTAASSSFSGSAAFDANNPGADLLKCIP